MEIHEKINFVLETGAQAGPNGRQSTFQGGSTEEGLLRKIGAHGNPRGSVDPGLTGSRKDRSY